MSFEDHLNKTKITPDTDSPRFNVVTGLELLEQPIEELPMLMDGLLMKSSVTVFAGSSDLGKSSWLRQLAIHIVTGEEYFCGFKLRPVHRNVIFISSEDDATITKSYLHKLNPSKKGMEGIRFVFDCENLVDCLKEMLSAQPADAVITDCMMDFYGSKLNQPNEYRQWLAPLKKLVVNKHQAQLLLLHHLGKRAEEREPNKANLLGTTAIEASARCVIELRGGDDPHDPDQRYLCILKANGLPSAAKAHAHELRFENLRFKSTGNRRPVYEIFKRSVERSTEQKTEQILKVMELHREGLSIRKIAEDTGVPSTTVHNWIKKCSVPSAPLGEEWNGTP